MTEAERLNNLLATEAPLVARCLSDLARRAAFPHGIPFQSAQARHTTFNATIGQLTDGDRNPMPLPEFSKSLVALDPKMAFLYSPAAGHRALRQAWQRRQRQFSGGSTATTSLPIVTVGITQALAHVAELFADANTRVLVPELRWTNYDLLFSLRQGATVVPYRQFTDEQQYTTTHLERLLAAQTGQKTIVVLNFPNNPTGYTPSVSEARQLVDLLVAQPGPLIVVCDDAYSGMHHEPGLQDRSLFWDLAERADPNRLFALRADGSTKELLFFGGRVGFLTHTLTGSAEAALESKITCLSRSIISSPVGPSQALVLAALQQPTLEASIEQTRQVLAERYRILKQALGQLQAPYRVFPFNSGFFALLAVDPTRPVDPLRHKLLLDFDTGVIALPARNAIRLAYCSLSASNIEHLVDRLRQAVG